MVRAECGALHIPEDRAHPEGRYLDLDIVVVRAAVLNHGTASAFPSMRASAYRLLCQLLRLLDPQAQDQN